MALLTEMIAYFSSTPFECPAKMHKNPKIKEAREKITMTESNMKRFMFKGHINLQELGSSCVRDR
jgi:hypothetical protein